MASAMLTSKGQVTIPVEVRVKLGLRPGSPIAFVPTATGGYEIYPEAASIKDLKGSVPQPLHPVSIVDLHPCGTVSPAPQARRDLLKHVRSVNRPAPGAVRLSPSDLSGRAATDEPRRSQG